MNIYNYHFITQRCFSGLFFSEGLHFLQCIIPSILIIQINYSSIYLTYRLLRLNYNVHVKKRIATRYFDVYFAKNI